MPSGWAAFNSANTAEISSAFFSVMSGLVLYLIKVCFIIFSMIDFSAIQASREMMPRSTLHAECHAGRVARIGEDRHDVVADLARRHRRAETGEEGFEADALAPRISLGRFAPELGVADDLLGEDRLETDAEIEPLGHIVRVVRHQPQHPLGAGVAAGKWRAVQRRPARCDDHAAAARQG